MDIAEYRSSAGVHYENDHRQMLLTFALTALAAFVSVLLILWAVM